MQQHKKQWIKYSGLICTAVLFAVLPMNAWADGLPKTSAMANPLAQVLVVIICVLLLAIALQQYQYNITHIRTKQYGCKTITTKLIKT